MGIKRKITVILMLSLFWHSFAEEEKLITYGIEVELAPTHLNTFINTIDFQKISDDGALNKNALASLFPEDALNDYLRKSPHAFKQLPEELKKKLTEGLDLKSRMIQGERPKIILGNETNLSDSLKPSLNLNPNGSTVASQINERPGFQAPANEGISESNKVFDNSLLSQRASGLSVPNTTDWEEVYKRWEKLPASEKIGYANLNLLPQDLKTSMFDVLFRRGIDKFDNLKFGTELPDGPSIPFTTAGGYKKFYIPLNIEPDSKLADTFKRVSFHRDQQMMEFIHFDPLTDPEVFKGDVKTLGNLGGISTFLDDPKEMLQNRGDRNRNFGSVHIHIGNKAFEDTNGGYPRKMKDALKTFFMLTMANEDRVIYNDKYGDLLKFEGKGIEFRDLPENFERFMGKLDHFLDSPTPEEAIAKINQEISSLSTKKNLTTLNQGNFNYREDVRSYLKANNLSDIDMDSLSMEGVSKLSIEQALPGSDEAKRFTYLAVLNATDEQLVDKDFINILRSDIRNLNHIANIKGSEATPKFVRNLNLLLEHPDMTAAFGVDEDTAVKIIKKYPSSNDSSPSRKAFETTYKKRQKLTASELRSYLTSQMKNTMSGRSNIEHFAKNNPKSLKHPDLLVELLEDQNLSHLERSRLLDALSKENKLVSRGIFNSDQVERLKTILLENDFDSGLRKGLLQKLALNGYIDQENMDRFIQNESLDIEFYETEGLKRAALRGSQSCLRRLLPL